MAAARRGPVRLFGLAALLWAVRTTTFVYDSIPAAWWTLWRLLYHASTGGFIIVLALFTLSLAGWYRRRYALALAAYWLAGRLSSCSPARTATR